MRAYQNSVTAMALMRTAREQLASAMDEVHGVELEIAAVVQPNTLPRLAGCAISMEARLERALNMLRTIQDLNRIDGETR
jgi:hypothetical protein